MNIFLILFIIIITVLFAALHISEVYGEKVPVDVYKTLKLRHDVKPTVCIFEVNPEISDKWGALQVMTMEGINEWRIKLMYAYPNGDWNMLVKDIIPWNKHLDKSPEDFPQCNIMINFEKKSNDKSIGNTALKFNKSYHKYMFINIFLESDKNTTVINMSEGNSTVTMKMTPVEMPTNSIKNIVIHELGHALGLEHYHIGTVIKKGDNASDRSVMISSINPFDETQKLSVTPLDLFMISQLYGEDGWNGVNPPYNIKNCYVLYPNIHSCN